ncbi:MAG: hypothetical protein J6C77_07130 [Muribaculaceae bacterium]|nr:hypothetical protein [Muribaculaceae bacterium]
MKPLRLITPLCLLLAACSDHSDSVTLELTPQSYTPEVQTQAPVRPAPAKAAAAPAGSAANAARLGRDDANALLANCHTTDEVRDALLDINARRSRIASLTSETVANQYLQAFLDQLEQSGDTLYTTLTPMCPLPQ